jgi:tetratricopeptide (TPR) repeat protein
MPPRCRSSATFRGAVGGCSQHAGAALDAGIRAVESSVCGLDCGSTTWRSPISGPDPALTFVHFNLGLTYLKQQDYENTRDEFLKDAAVEPDLALDYDELGDVYALLQQDSNAKKSYHEALQRDPPRLATPPRKP